MDRAPGISVRLKLTLSYVGLLVLAGALLLAVVWVFLLRYVPDRTIRTETGAFVPNRADLVDAFVPNATLALLLLLIFGLIGGWLVAGRMLAPLTRLMEGTRVAAAGNLSHRVQLQGRRDEFRELADAFDSMLARLDMQLTEQQRFAANASHELRTPLAISQTLLDVAHNDPNHDSAELISRLRTVNSRAIELAEALLLLSRADQGSFTRERVDLSLLAEEAAETLLPLAEKRGVTLDTDGDIAIVSGSRALLQQMTTNLIHNAIVHNSPVSGRVWVATSRQDDASVALSVENTGDELDPHLTASLSEPFHRGAERARTSDHAGVGLGLAIVVSIARAHDGTVTIEPRPAGGLRVTVRLPARFTENHGVTHPS